METSDVVVQVVGAVLGAGIAAALWWYGLYRAAKWRDGR